LLRDHYVYLHRHYQQRQHQLLYTANYYSSTFWLLERYFRIFTKMLFLLFCCRSSQPPWVCWSTYCLLAALPFLCEIFDPVKRRKTK